MNSGVQGWQPGIAKEGRKRKKATSYTMNTTERRRLLGSINSDGNDRVRSMPY